MKPRVGDVVMLTKRTKWSSTYAGVVFSTNPLFIYPVAGHGCRGVTVPELDDEYEIQIVPQGFLVRLGLFIASRWKMITNEWR